MDPAAAGPLPERPVKHFDEVEPTLNNVVNSRLPGFCLSFASLREFFSVRAAASVKFSG
jgi:hypothetical protein